MSNVWRPAYADPASSEPETPVSPDVDAQSEVSPMTPVDAALEEALPDGRYSDRELSWLAFNKRVLELAMDEDRVPLLERAKFLAIFSSNLDEFFMVRVAGLKRRIAAGVATTSASGMMPRELQDAILSRTHDLVERAGTGLRRRRPATARGRGHQDPALVGAHHRGADTASPSCSTTGSCRC